MMKKLIPVLAAAILAGSIFSQSYAEDIKNKWIFSLNVGNLTTVDEIRSEADNRAYYLDGEEVIAVRIDPRPDEAATNAFKIQDTFQVQFGVSYGFTSMFLIETTLGYSKGDVEDLEIAVRFPDDIDPEAKKLYEEKGEHLFRVYYTPVGKLTRVPLQTSAIVRFRPKSTFNPYLGAGIGYIFVKYESSEELNEFSANIDHSTGGFREAGATEIFLSDLSGVTVEAPSSLEYHIIGGFDYTFKKHWSIFLDARYIFAARRMKLKVNNLERFGIGFPNGRVEQWDLIPPVEGQPYQITEGGAFDFNQDGVLDGGLYYVNGGNLKYGGFSFGVGVKYTF